jgi:hypothetical protein
MKIMSQDMKTIILNLKTKKIRLKVQSWKEIFHANRNQKRAGGSHTSIR